MTLIPPSARKVDAVILGEQDVIDFLLQMTIAILLSYIDVC